MRKALALPQLRASRFRQQLLHSAIPSFVSGRSPSQERRKMRITRFSPSGVQLAFYIRSLATTGPPLQIVTLLIDGDILGPESWDAIIAAISHEPKALQAKVFCAEPSSTNKKWKETAIRLNIQIRVVSRKAGGAKDPNDMAIAMEASHVAAQGAASLVALAVGDIDFVYVAERLHVLGQKVLAVIPESSSNRLASAFKVAGADVLRFAQHVDGEHLPRKKMVLQPNGTGTIEDVHHSESPQPLGLGEHAIAEQLLQLGFIHSLDDPLVPGLAKFYHSNTLGPLTVWPPNYSLAESGLMISSRKHRWRGNPGNLVFALPMANGYKSKENISRYGSINCARFSNAGGPFMLEDTEQLVVEFLKRLGYVDMDLNSSIGEAIDVFCCMKLNKKALSSIGLQIAPIFREHTKKALLHGALMSTCLSGTWQIAPRDASVRSTLARLNLIASANASTKDVFDAMHVYVQRQQLSHRHTYNGLVLEVLNDLQKNCAWPCDRFGYNDTERLVY